MKNRLYEWWKGKSDDDIDFDADSIKITYDTSGIYSTTASGTSPIFTGSTTTTPSTPSGYWVPGTSTTTTGRTTSGGYFSSGFYGWGELSVLQGSLEQLSFAIGHNLRQSSNYSELGGIGLQCDDCDIREVMPWAGTYGERVQVMGALMMGMLRRHAYQL